MSKLKIGPVSAEKENETEKVETPKAELPKKGQRGQLKLKPYHKAGFIRASVKNVLKHRPDAVLSWTKRGTVVTKQIPYQVLDTYRQTKLFLATARAELEQGEVLVIMKRGEA